MAQDDLFAEKGTLDLPAVRYGPVRVAIGVVEAILRPVCTVEAKRVGEVHISARLKEPLYQTADGERLVVTTRKNVARPSEADGVLRRSESGRLSWLYQRRIEVLKTKLRCMDGQRLPESVLSNGTAGLSFRAEHRTRMVASSRRCAGFGRTARRTAPIGPTGASTRSRDHRHGRPGTGKTETMRRRKRPICASHCW